jgi:hypothetical protein
METGRIVLNQPFLAVELALDSHAPLQGVETVYRFLQGAP